jgi:vitamin B12 transporter
MHHSGIAPVTAMVLTVIAWLPAAAGGAEIENVVIIANRVPTPAPEVGSTISTVDRATIERRQSVFVSDLLQDVPGVAVGRAGPFGAQSQVRVRGAEGNHVLVLIDGVEANDPSAGDEFSFEHLSAVDVERIEILRGPQSALWGSDALAGVVNVITRRGGEPLRGSGFLEGGSFDTRHGGARIGASWNQSSADFSISRLDTDGENLSFTGDEDDGYENTTATFTADFRPVPRLGIGLFARHTDATSAFDAIDFLNTGLPADAELESDVSLTYLRGSGMYSLLDGQWEHGLRLTWTNSDREILEAGSQTSATDGQKQGVYYQTSYAWGATDSGGASSKIIFAVDYEKEEFTQTGEASAFGNPNQTQDMDNIGYVVEYVGRPLGSLSFSGSVRYDDNSDFDNVFTWRLTATRSFASTATRVRGSVGVGQKSPTFIERFGFFADQFIGNPDLRPEESTGWDVGVEQRLWDDRLRVDVTYFNQRLDDEINGFAFDAVAGGFTAENLQGSSRRKGIEFEAAAKLAGGVEATASYTYSDSRQPDAGGDKAREIRRPRHMAALNLNYALLGDRLSLNLNASHTGKQLDTFFPPFPNPQQTVVLDEYTLVNLAASFALTDSISIFARVENLLDEDYQNVVGFRNPGVGGYAGIRAGFGR